MFRDQLKQIERRFESEDEQTELDRYVQRVRDFLSKFEGSITDAGAVLYSDEVHVDSPERGCRMPQRDRRHPYVSQILRWG